MRSMTRKASGTWSSDSDSVMSAAAEYFYKEKKPDCVIPHMELKCISSVYILCLMRAKADSYPKGPVSIYSDNEVDNID